jgi:hypothetical protein
VEALVLREFAVAEPDPLITQFIMNPRTGQMQAVTVLDTGASTALEAEQDLRAILISDGRHRAGELRALLEQDAPVDLAPAREDWNRWVCVCLRSEELSVEAEAASLPQLQALVTEVQDPQDRLLFLRKAYLRTVEPEALRRMLWRTLGGDPHLGGYPPWSQPLSRPGDELRLTRLMPLEAVRSPLEELVATADRIGFQPPLNVARSGQTRRVSVQRGRPDPAERARRLREIHEALLASEPTFTSADIGALRNSFNANSSQLAKDLRQAGRLFGVKRGREWLYPRFQFDDRGQLYPEMQQVLTAFTAEASQWDVLQWFQEPQATLGATPREIWAKDRAAVVKAAQGEHWFARD